MHAVLHCSLALYVAWTSPLEHRSDHWSAFIAGWYELHCMITLVECSSDGAVARLDDLCQEWRARVPRLVVLERPILSNQCVARLC